MKVAVMQPYAFPYLGYFQLMAAVDTFVLLDDVAWIKSGWINRNRLAGRAGVQPFVFPVTGTSSRAKIADVELYQPDRFRRRFIGALHALYTRSPHFRQTLGLVDDCLARHRGLIADSIAHMLRRLAAHLDIGCRILRSRDEFPHVPGKGAERIAGICKALGARTYVNAEGGRDLYRSGDFGRYGIELRFLEHVPRPYRNNLPEFEPRLSIVDVLMFNGREKTLEMLGDYLLSPAREAASR